MVNGQLVIRQGQGIVMHQPGEPSVEEILDSIKKVIARDNRDGAIAERRRRSPEGVEANSIAEQAGPVADNTADEVLELGAEIALSENRDDGIYVHADATAVEAGDDTDDALIGANTRDAMRQNFAALAMLAQPGKQPQIVRSGETSLEGLVRDMLRPMLAEWLDANLPTMVEDLVKAEISRIAGKRS